ncbi:MAG: helix-turn-helix transcriptional regulator [Eubacteriales bacterium]|nr:helix-turn-helix transcriptional regulator [Eubacteriales bacterium]
MKTYWERIRELREDRDLSQNDIAAVLGTTQQVYSRYEKGINELPLRHLVTLCRYFKVTPDYILGLSREEKK